MPGKFFDPRGTGGIICMLCRQDGKTGIGCAWMLQKKEDVGRIPTPEHRIEHDNFLKSLTQAVNPAATMEIPESQIDVVNWPFE